MLMVVALKKISLRQGHLIIFPGNGFLEGFIHLPGRHELTTDSASKKLHSEATRIARRWQLKAFMHQKASLEVNASQNLQLKSNLIV